MLQRELEILEVVIEADEPSQHLFLAANDVISENVTKYVSTIDS